MVSYNMASITKHAHTHLYIYQHEHYAGCISRCTCRYVVRNVKQRPMCIRLCVCICRGLRNYERMATHLNAIAKCQIQNLVEFLILSWFENWRGIRGRKGELTSNKYLKNKFWIWIANGLFYERICVRAAFRNWFKMLESTFAATQRPRNRRASPDYEMKIAWPKLWLRSTHKTNNWSRIVCAMTRTSRCQNRTNIDGWQSKWSNIIYRFNLEHEDLNNTKIVYSGVCAHRFLQ